MKTSVFWGCCIEANQFAYEMSVRETLPKLNVELVDLSESICCGDPVKSMNEFAATFLAARVIALALSTGQKNLLIPCNRCHFTLSEAARTIRSNSKIRGKISEMLKEEDLTLDLNVKMWHTIDLLHDFVGVERIKDAVTRPLKGLRLVIHPGCQVIRYSDLGRVDDAENPQKLNSLVIALGAEIVDYPERLDCCGAALTRSHPESALSLAGSKLKAVQSLAVEGMVVSCPDCHLMFDAKQKEAGTVVGTKLKVPVVYYTQLLGLALGIEETRLGFHLNQSPTEELLAKIRR